MALQWYSNYSYYSDLTYFVELYDWQYDYDYISYMYYENGYLYYCNDGEYLYWYDSSDEEWSFVYSSWWSGC